MDLGLGGCVALVGGSSSGIGAAVARDLAAEGCRVVLFARRGELLNDVANAIERDTGSSAVAVQGDSSSDADLGRCGGALRTRGSAASTSSSTTRAALRQATSPASTTAPWQRAYDQLVLSSVRATRHALPMLRASGRGRVITITSSSVLEAEPPAWGSQTRCAPGSPAGRRRSRARRGPTGSP